MIFLNSQMEQFFKVLLLIAIVFVLGGYIVDKLETEYSSFTEEELKSVSMQIEDYGNE